MTQAIAKALAKALAHVALGNKAETARWTRVLVTLLQESGLPVQMKE